MSLNIPKVCLVFVGTIVYEDGEIVGKISRKIYETGNAESVSQIDSYWWKSDSR